MTDIPQALAALGVEPARIHTELFGALPSITPGVVGRAARAPHQPPGPPGTGPLVTFARSGLSAPFPAGDGQPCSNWPTPATSRPAGAAAPACATPA